MAPSKKSSKSTAAADTPSAVAESKVDKVEVTEETTVVESEVDKYDVVLDKLNNFVNEAKELISIVKNLKKENAKTQKAGNKRQRKVANDGTKRPASGITKPTKLSDELCDFLGVPKGTSLARTEVTKIINNYIKSNKLQDETDRRTIHPDEKLKKILLPIPADKKLSFFNMQSFIKHQFVKA
jgi:chromatin remodeling complex protein RSC6